MKSISLGDRLFANFYEVFSRSAAAHKQLDPWRKKMTSLATGMVLEIGAGSGQNFAFYQPHVTQHLTAIEPNAAMLDHAQHRAAASAVPVKIICTPVETLPFDDDSFDSVLATLVFCSVQDPLQGLQEVYRVLKPDGKLLLFEHVQNKQPFWHSVQNILNPVERKFGGNCHLNRDTAATVQQAGFNIESIERHGFGVLPEIALIARKSD